MATQVLHPQDILNQRNRFNPPSSVLPRRKTFTRPDSRKKKEFVAGEATILKRGEPVESKSPDLVVPKQIRVKVGEEEVYAGSAVSSSPSPRELPLPTFSVMKVRSSFDDFATRDLRRLLGLDLASEI